MTNDKMKREPGLMWQKNSLKVTIDFRVCFKHDKTANFAKDCLQNVYKGNNYKDIPYKSKPLHSSNRGDTTGTAREGCDSRRESMKLCNPPILRRCSCRLFHTAIISQSSD